MTLQYISGFFDADGSIGLYQTQQKLNWRYPRCTFHSSNHIFLEQIDNLIRQHVVIKNNSKIFSKRAC